MKGVAIMEAVLLILVVLVVVSLGGVLLHEIDKGMDEDEDGAH